MVRVSVRNMVGRTLILNRGHFSSFTYADGRRAVNCGDGMCLMIIDVDVDMTCSCRLYLTTH